MVSNLSGGKLLEGFQNSPGDSNMDSGLRTSGTMVVAVEQDSGWT